jgi:hypothetical protein
MENICLGALLLSRICLDSEECFYSRLHNGVRCLVAYCRVRLILLHNKVCFAQLKGCFHFLHNRVRLFLLHDSSVVLPLHNEVRFRLLHNEV